MVGNSQTIWSHLRLVAALLGAAVVASCSDSDNNGGGGGGGPPQQPPDTTSPTVTLSVPDTASARSITFTADASDNVGVTQVEFFVDGTSIGVDMTAPYSIDWNSSSATDGAHLVTARATDAAGNATTTAASTVTVRNNLPITVALSGFQEWPVETNTGASGTGDLTVNVASGAISGSFAFTGMIPTAAHIHEAFAGVNGDVRIPLTMDPTTTRWEIPANTTLTTAQLDTLLRGGMYVNAHSGTFPEGEIRGQIEPANIDVYFTTFSTAQLLEPAANRGTGRGAITVNRDTRAAVAHAVVNGLGNVTGVKLREAVAGVAGSEVLALTQDTADPAHWFSADNTTLTEAAMTALTTAALYFNVESDSHPNGELRGQLVPPNYVVGFARLNGLQEVPATDSAATGLGAVTVNRDASTATIHLTTRDLSGATAAHIHGNYGGRNGDVLIGLNQDGSNPAHWSAVDQPITAEQITALTNGATYLNAHTPAHPGGEIRGQVLTPGVLFIVAPLERDQEVPALEEEEEEDEGGGTAALTVVLASRDFVLHANTDGVDDATAAHIHFGYAGEAGPVEIGLTQDAADPKHWSAEGELEVTQLATIVAGGAYVNVHTPEYPGGAIRGQLVADNVRLVFTGMSGSEEVPPVPIDARGLAATTVDLATRKVTVHVRTSGVDDATAAHIHKGARGTTGPVLIPFDMEAGNPQHWFTEAFPVTDADISDFLGALWYANVHTPAHPGGAIRGQVGLDALAPPDTVAPVISIVAPPATVSGTVMLTANATDNVAVTGVTFFANGTQIGTVSAQPYTIAWDTTTVPNGAVTLTADATDAGGNVGHATGIGVVVVNAAPPPPDTTPPTVTLNSPGASVSGTVELTVVATDDVGVTSVRWYVNGAELGNDATMPYSIQWNTTTVANGNVTLTADARDAAGNVGQSAPVNVTVNNVTATTLTQLQTQIFTAKGCSGCHTGGGAVLPASMNLTSAANSFAALVNVASVGRPAVPRVVPNDPAGSYLVRKLNGGPDIDGVRMPQGGPFLSAAEMSLVTSWIDSGAPNN